MNNTWSFIKGIITSKYLALLLRFYIGYVFISAALAKIPAPAQFMGNVASYEMAPYFAINFVAVVLPWTELICGLFLVIGLWGRAAASIMAVLLVMFTVGITLNVLRDVPISCGCFDSVGEPISWWTVLRDLSWLALTLQIFFFDRITLLRRGRFFIGKNFGMRPAS